MNLVLKKAEEVINKNKEMYGDPKDNIELIAERWKTIFKVDVKPMMVLLAMIDLKISRIINNETYADSLVDIAGYAGLAENFINVEN